MFAIPIAALVILIIAGIALAFAAFIYWTGDALPDLGFPKLSVSLSLIAAALVIWGVTASSYRKIDRTEYYNINNVNYTDDMIGQVYIKNGTPIKLYSDVVYDNDVFHVKIDVYENGTWGIKWGYSEAPLKIVKKTIIRTKE